MLSLSNLGAALPSIFRLAIITSIIPAIRFIKYSTKANINNNNDIIIIGIANAGKIERNSGMQLRNKLLIAPPSVNGFNNEHNTSIIHKIKLSTGRKNL